MALTTDCKTGAVSPSHFSLTTRGYRICNPNRSYTIKGEDRLPFEPGKIAPLQDMIHKVIRLGLGRLFGCVEFSVERVGSFSFRKLSLFHRNVRFSIYKWRRESTPTFPFPLKNQEILRLLPTIPESEKASVFTVNSFPILGDVGRKDLSATTFVSFRAIWFSHLRVCFCPKIKTTDHPWNTMTQLSLVAGLFLFEAHVFSFLRPSQSTWYDFSKCNFEKKLSFKSFQIEA